MKPWEQALDKFIQNWKDKPEVIAAMVCGSYVTGNPSKHSDIDVHILLDKNTDWRERGNVVMDGFLIEYFANPISLHYDYAESDYKRRARFNAHMFCTGRILFDKTGEIKKLIEDMKEYLEKPYPVLSSVDVEQMKYALWDMCDNLEEAIQADDFEFVYHTMLYGLFEQYSQFLRYEAIPVHKLRRFFLNDQDKKKYFVKSFPDEEFESLYVEAMCEQNKERMLDFYKQLTQHVLTRMGGFSIDGWKLRTPAQNEKKQP